MPQYRDSRNIFCAFPDFSRENHNVTKKKYFDFFLEKMGETGYN